MRLWKGGAKVVSHPVLTGKKAYDDLIKLVVKMGGDSVMYIVLPGGF